MAKQALAGWILWLLITVAGAGYLATQLVAGEQKPALIIGPGSHGHYQIELQCGACHTSPFGGTDVLQNACEGCHLAELDAVLDSHPKKKFTNPRNANRIENLDARYCVACHREHNPTITNAMGVTLAEDFCIECHRDVGEERASHAGMGFDTCASAGCHNFHDNLALYEDFLLKHADAPAFNGGTLPPRNLGDYIATLDLNWPATAIAPVPAAFDQPDVHQQWAGSAHSRAQVSCDNCHRADGSGDWLEKPGVATCETCHRDEAVGFLAGKHGVRLAQGLPAMTPGEARQPMHDTAAHRQLTCNSCHLPHDADTKVAATDACLGCHADEHSQNFKASPHFALWQQVDRGEMPPESAVTCATCHMPRLTSRENGIERVRVEHNQNTTLRPNEKMIRPVCMNCHGLGFAIDALADPALVRNNFLGVPSAHIPSIDMAIERDKDTTF